MSIPHFILIDPHSDLCEAWIRALKKYFGEEGEQHFTIREGRLQDIDPAILRCDCMVSPANSFGIMDGGYDLVLSRVFMGETNDVERLTHHVQDVLRARWRGFVPPTTCTLVDLPSDVSGKGRNPWEARVLAVVPTMRVPDIVDWHRDLVYNSMWCILAEIMRWNESHAGDEQIHRVLMTGLGTGTGNISAEKCAMQMVLAAKHFKQGFPEEPEWKHAIPASREVDQTTLL